MQTTVNLLQVGIELPWVNRSEQGRWLGSHLIEFSQVASVNLELISTLIHLNYFEIESLQRQLTVLLNSDLVLEVSKLLAILNLFLLNSQECYEDESQSQAYNKEYTDWDQSALSDSEHAQCEKACYDTACHQYAKHYDVFDPGYVDFTKAVYRFQILGNLLLWPFRQIMQVKPDLTCLLHTGQVLFSRSHCSWLEDKGLQGV